MITTILRLEFKHVFPEEKEKPLIEYLKLISPEMLLSIIGFSNTTPMPNFDNINSNHSIQKDIIQRVKNYCTKERIVEKPIVISREASLKLAEYILSNKQTLINNALTKSFDHDTEETSILKSFLVINKEVNSRKQYSISENDVVEKVAEILISISFPIADLGSLNSHDNDLEFLKLFYAATIRLELLIGFLQSNSEYSYLEESLFNYFKLENSNQLIIEVKKLFLHLLQVKTENKFKLFVEDERLRSFLDSLVSNEISEDEDFTNLRNYPLYKLDEKTYSIIDYFFVPDKFIKSVKFSLKKTYDAKHNLSSKSGDFFNFYNTKYSEECLMKSILDKIYSKKYLIKKQTKNDKKNEPDYYVRHNNRIYLFENKDVLISKKVKSSDDVETILNTLKERFLEADGKPVGIGQLITSIRLIVENDFQFDEYVNQKKNLTIYPILLVSDRIFAIPGMNYILNKWYINGVTTALKDKFNKNFIKNLTVIDIDTLIFWLPYLENDDVKFRGIIDSHLLKMSTQKKPYGNNAIELNKSHNKNILEQISPINYRLRGNEFPFEKHIVSKFKDVLTQ
jgi:hypothetical protein